MRILTLGFLTALLLPLAAMAGESVNYSVNGAPYEGYLQKASGKSKGLVLIIHDWDGIDGYETKRAEMVSQLGYDAFAVDLYGKGVRPADNDGKKAESGKLYKDREKMRALLLGGLMEARKHTKGQAVVIGYCFGGAAALEMARSGKAGDIAGYVTFHGGLTTPEGQGYAKGTPPILVTHGGADTSVTMEHVAGLSKELEAAGIAYEVQVYSGAPHAFTVYGSDRYRKDADEKSWAAFKDFLAARLP